MHYRVILNPAAGRGRGALARKAVEQTLSAAGAQFDLAETTGPGHAVTLARDAASSYYDAIVAVGGDGTAHHVVAGLVAAAQANGSWFTGRQLGPLGLVPVGTGNDYAWRLGVTENDPEAACGLLDLVLADSPNVPMMLYLLVHVLAGTHIYRKRYVALDRTDGVVIEAPDGIPVHLDGEVFRTDARRLDISVLPRRLEVIGG